MRMIKTKMRMIKTKTKTINDLNNEIRDRIASIKINEDYQVIAYWICWFLCIVIILSTFITTPIRYSEEEPIYKVSYNRLYYYLTLGTLFLLCYYIYKARDRLPLITGEDIYIKAIPVVVLFLGFIVLNIYDSPGEKEDGSFNTPPSTLVKNKYVMIFQYVLLLLLLLTIIGLDINKSANGVNNVESFHLKRAAPALITVIVASFYLYNSVKYNVKRYNLPETWRK